MAMSIDLIALVREVSEINDADEIANRILEEKSVERAAILSFRLSELREAAGDQ